MQEPGRNEGPATGVIRFERVGHALRGKEHRRRKPGGAGREVEATRQRGEGARLRVVDSTEAVGLHHPMPDAPEENDENDPFQVPPGKKRRKQRLKNRRKNEAPAKPFEQSAIAVGADHSREMVAHCAKCGHENVNVLRAPARLRQQEHRHEKKRRPDVKNQVAPTVENPQRLFRRRDGRSWNGLRP